LVFADYYFLKKLSRQLNVDFDTSAISNGNLNTEVLDDLNIGALGFTHRTDKHTSGVFTLDKKP
jgi:hypothetical protein